MVDADKPPVESTPVTDVNKDKPDLNMDELANGPIEKRSCTDIPCCCIFLVFIAGMFLASMYGYTRGDPKLLLTMWDSDGNGCGYNATTKDYPLLYFPAPSMSGLKSLGKVAASGASAASSAANGNTNTTSNVSSGAIASAVGEVLKYAVCVKTCPTKDNTTTVSCKPPSFFAKDASSSTPKWKNCQYYPMGYSTTGLAAANVAGVDGVLRYDTV